MIADEILERLDYLASRDPEMGACMDGHFIKILIDEFESLKCCMNCGSQTCPYNLPAEWSRYCKSWEFDNLTQKDRLIE